MFKLIRRLFRWALYVFIIAVVLAVAGVLLLNTIVKQIMESRLRSETGMDVAIGKVDVGLSTPTISIEDLRIYNTPEFGGSLFLSLPEIFLDYDRDAIRAHKLHLNLLRLNLAELDIVRDKNGRLNIDSLSGPKKAVMDTITNSTSAPLAFAGIDTLNVTFQNLQISGLDNTRPQVMRVGLTNQIFHDLKSARDFEVMAVVLGARGSAAVGSTNADEIQNVFQQLLR